jgi:hypothetical protein
VYNFIIKILVFLRIILILFKGRLIKFLEISIRKILKPIPIVTIPQILKQLIVRIFSQNKYNLAPFFRDPLTASIHLDRIVPVERKSLNIQRREMKITVISPLDEKTLLKFKSPKYY